MPENIELINSIPERNEPWRISLNSIDSVDYAAPVYSNLDESKEEDREHVKIFERIFTLFSTFVNLLGIELSYHWKPHRRPMFVVIILTMIFVWFSMFYTQFIHIKCGEIMRVLEICAIYGVAISNTQKMLCYLKKYKDVTSLFYCIRKICRQNTECSSQSDILTSNLNGTLKYLKVFAAGVTFSLLLFVAGPLKSYVFDNELIPLLPLEIIYVNQDTFSGFVIANIFMSGIGVLAVLGTTLYGATFIFAILMYSMQVDLIGQDFRDLDSMWAEDSAVSLTCKTSLLRNICEKLQDIKNYMNGVRDIFETKFFYYFCFSYLSQIICLFEITKNHWLPGYGVAMYSLIEMMFYCIMGSQITIADERLCSFIYASNWYKYDIRSQKILALLLHRAQQPGELLLGPIGPLTVATGVEVIKGIYSYYTFLTKVL